METNSNDSTKACHKTRKLIELSKKVEDDMVEDRPQKKLRLQRDALEDDNVMDMSLMVMETEKNEVLKALLEDDHTMDVSGPPMAAYNTTTTQMVEEEQKDQPDLMEMEQETEETVYTSHITKPEMLEAGKQKFAEMMRNGGRLVKKPRRTRKQKSGSTRTKPQGTITDYISNNIVGGAQTGRKRKVGGEPDATMLEERTLKKIRRSTLLKPDVQGPKSEIRDYPEYQHPSIRTLKKELPRDLSEKVYFPETFTYV